MSVKRNLCNTCEHYKAEYAPFIGRMVMTCELTKRNPMCHGNYKHKKEDSDELNGSSTKKD